MKKLLHKNLCCFGHFYKKHWKVLVGAKVVLLAVVLTLSFTVRSDNGKMIQHGVAPIYAEGLCGNGKCDNIPAYCSIAHTDCGYLTIDMNACPTVPGCSLTSVDVSECRGTTWSCKAIQSQTFCGAAGCFRNTGAGLGSCTDVNPDTGNPEVDQNCSAITNDTMCNGAATSASGDCSWIGRTTERCSGTIIVPQDENACNALLQSSMIPTHDYYAVLRIPEYNETHDSCPDDCTVTDPVCGNGSIEKGEQCDDGKNNGNPGYCNNNCDGRMCSGIETTGSCASLITDKQTCNSSYSSLDQTRCYYSDEQKRCMDEMSCTLPVSAICGNGSIEKGEDCDDENTTDGDGCSATCTLETPTCVLLSSFVSRDDEANTVTLNLNPQSQDPTNFQSLTYIDYGDGTSGTDTEHIYGISGKYIPVAYIQSTVGGASAHGSCSTTFDSNATPTQTQSTCGNGILEGDEQCDDSNTNDGDGCNSNCFVEPGCNIWMTGETDQLPFTGYFRYKISDSTSVDTISYDDSTSEKMDGKSTTFEHLYTQWNPAYQPELHVYNTAHPEMQGSCKTSYAVCSPFNPEYCSSEALGDRGFQCKDISAGECMLLIQLYDATDGKDWNNHKGWLKDSNACDRHGITCTESGDVKYLQSINLSNNNLQGTLPVTMDLALPYISNIVNTSDDDDFLTRLPFLHLETLNLSHNHLDGTIPMGYFMMFPFLKTLNFSYNDFSSLFGNEALVSIPAMPGYDARSQIAEDQGYGGLLSMINNISFVSKNNFGPYFTFNVLNQRMDFPHLLLDYITNRSSDSSGSFSSAGYVGSTTVNNSNARNGFQWLIKLGSFITPDNKDKLTSIYHYYQEDFTSTNLFLDPLTQYTFGATGSLDGTLFGDIANGVNAILADERGDDSVQKPDFFNSVGNNLGFLSKIMEDQDAVNNIIPVATSLLQSAMGMFNHLTDIDLSHNSISQLPAYLPLPACANTFNLSYNDLIGNLPTVTYFGYGAGPLITKYYGISPSTTLDVKNAPESVSNLDLYRALSYKSIKLQALDTIKEGQSLTGTHTSLLMGDTIGTLQVTDHRNFWTQIAIIDPVPTKPINTTVFGGDGCTQNTVSGVITCNTAFNKGKSSQGQYVGVFTIGDDGSFHGAVCVHRGGGVRTYDEASMTFDPDNLCTSLGMEAPKNNELEIAWTKIGEPYICDRGDNNDITLNLSHNQLDGTLPGILSMNSTTLDGLTDVSAGTGPLWTLMKPAPKVTIHALLNDNNLTDNRLPASWGSTTQGNVANNCLTWSDINSLQTDYLGNFWEGWNTQRMCSFPRIIYTPSQDKGTTDGPVTAEILLPKNCSIVNNNQQTTYDFDTNGAFAFEVACPGLEHHIFLMGKVSWIGSSTTTILVNAGDLNTDSTSSIYNDNTQNTVLSQLDATLSVKKQKVSKVAVDGIPGMESVDTQTIKTVNNLDFRNDPSVYTTYIVYTPETTDSNKTISVTIPQDTTLNAIHDDEKTSYSGIFYAPQEITDPVLVNKFLSETNMDTVTKIIHIGSDTSDEDTTLVADDSSGQAQNFVVTIDTDDAVGTPLQIFSSQDGNTWTFYGTSVVASSGEKNVIAFTVPHLTYFGIGAGTNTTGTNNTGTNNTGTNNTGTDETGTHETLGGIIPSAGGVRLVMDYCPQGDNSQSYYDNTCKGTSHTIVPSYAKDTVDTAELRSAYLYALDHGIISSSSADALLYNKITRRDLAKLIALYAKNVVGIVPVISAKGCAFTDTAHESPRTNVFIQTVCKLGLMGVNKDGKTAKNTFDPGLLVSRAEFATILSRLLYDGKYNPPLYSPAKRYELHLQALKVKGVIKNTVQPFAAETKGYILIMLQRTDQLIINAMTQQGATSTSTQSGVGILSDITTMLKNLLLKK